MSLRIRTAAGVAASVMILGGLFFMTGGESAARFFMYEALPFYHAEAVAEEAGAIADPAVAEVFKGEDATPMGGAGSLETGFAAAALAEAIDQDDEHGYEEPAREAGALTAYDIDEMNDLAYLKAHVYTVDGGAASGTELLAGDVDAAAFLAMDMRLRDGAGPKVLIFHTHMYECFADSDPENPGEGVYGAGERLARRLRAKGIEVLHCPARFDVTAGAINIQGAYERMEPVIEGILRDNPSIEVVLDLHRDGVPNDEKNVAVIGGKPAARVMFFNGMSRLKQGGVVKPVNSLPNPFQRENLAFSFQAKLAADRLYPGFAKKIYLKAYRYSLHMAGKSLLIEVGNQNNTMAEAAVAMDALADVLADVLLPEQ